LRRKDNLSLRLAQKIRRLKPLLVKQNLSPQKKTARLQSPESQTKPAAVQVKDKDGENYALFFFSPRRLILFV